MVMLFDGNIQSFSYNLMFDSCNLMSFNPKEKILNGSALLMFWVIIMYMASGIFLLLYFYRNSANYFYENYKRSLPGLFMLFFHKGFMNFALGSVHFILENHYNMKLLVLSLIEGIFIVLTLLLISKSRIVIRK